MFNSIIKAAHAKPNEEICGIITKDFLVFADNISKNPRIHFEISPSIYFDIKIKSGIEISSVFHSHVLGSAEPSLADTEMSDNCLINYLIYSIITNEFCTYNPLLKQKKYFRSV